MNKLQTTKNYKYIRISLLFSLFISVYLPFQFQQTFAINASSEIDFKYYWDNDLVLFFGPGLESDFNVPLENLRNGTYDRVENLQFTRINKLNNSLTFQLSGSYLWDVLNKSQKVNQNASFAQFIGEDGYGYGNVFVKLPLRIIQDHPNQIYIATHIDGDLIDSTEGPLRMDVEMEAIQFDVEMIEMYEDLFEEGENFVHNSKLSAQRVAAIFISDQPTGYEQDSTETTNSNSNTETTTTITTSSSTTTTQNNKNTFSIPGYPTNSIIIGLFLCLLAIKHRKSKFIP